MDHPRTHAVAPSNSARTIDVETALDVLEMRLAENLSEFASLAHLPNAGEMFGRLRDLAIGRAVAVLAQPGTPDDDLEVAYALACAA